MESVKGRRRQTREKSLGDPKLYLLELSLAGEKGKVKINAEGKWVVDE